MIHNMNVGGTEKSLLSLLSALDQSKYDVTVLMLEKYGGYLDDIPRWVKIKFVENYDQMKPIVMDPPIQTIKRLIKNKKYNIALETTISYLKAKSFNNWAYFYKQVLKNYTVESYDIAIAYAGPSDFITYFVSERIDAPKKIQWIHFDVLKIKLNKNFGEKYYPKFDLTNCVSKNAQIEMQQLFPEIKDKIGVFRNLVNKKEIIELSNKAESFTDNYKGIRILTLGRLYKEKGQQLIPKAVLELKNRGYDFKWYCIGDGSLRPELEKAIKIHNLQDNLILLGTKKNPYPFIKDCDIYVQTSLHEGYGLTLHEARILNKPIVSTKFKGVEEQINDGFNGITVDISFDGLYNGIKKLINDEQIRQKFINNLKSENDKELTREVIF